MCVPGAVAQLLLSPPSAGPAEPPAASRALLACPEMTQPLIPLWFTVWCGGRRFSIRLCSRSCSRMSHGDGGAQQQAGEANSPCDGDSAPAGGGVSTAIVSPHRLMTKVFLPLSL